MAVSNEPTPGKIIFLDFNRSEAEFATDTSTSRDL